MTFISGPGRLISTNNSSTSTLAGDAVYTGTREDVSNYTCIKIIVKADKDRRFLNTKILIPQYLY
jgi:hypothetical protein